MTTKDTREEEEQVRKVLRAQWMAGIIKEIEEEGFKKFAYAQYKDCSDLRTRLLKDMGEAYARVSVDPSRHHKEEVSTDLDEIKEATKKIIWILDKHSLF